MKRCLVAITGSLLLLVLNGNAQKIGVGLKGGLSLTEVTANVFTPKYTASFQIGGYAEKKLNKKWGLQSELLLNIVSTQKSDQFDKIYYNYQTLSASDKAKIYYLSLPVLATYKLNNTISLMLGPQFSATVGSNENLFRNGTPAFKTLDLSLTGGAKFDFNGVKLYGRYNYGLTDINNYDNRDTWKNMQINIGLEIPIVNIK